MPSLINAARDLLEHPVRPAKPVEVIVKKARARRRRHRLTTAIAIVMVATGTAAGILLFVGPNRGQTVTVTPPSTARAGRPSSPSVSPSFPSVSRQSMAWPGYAPGAEVPATPAGWIRVSYHNASVAVPRSWQVVVASEVQCPIGQNVVVFDEGDTSACPPGLPPPDERVVPLVSYARFQPLPGHLPDGTPTRIAGLEAIAVSSPGKSSSYVFPQLGAVLTLDGPSSASILDSIGWSGAYVVLHPPGPVAVPNNWRTVTYDGIALRVPPTWPTVSLGSGTMPGGCGHADFPAHSLIIGSACYLSSGVVANIAGVWIYSLFRGDYPLAVPPEESPISLRSGPAALLAWPQDTRGADLTSGPTGTTPVLSLAAENSAGTWVGIEVSFGSNPATARSIIASIRSLPITSPPPTTDTSASSPRP